jgi:hypothetical protein
VAQPLLEQIFAHDADALAEALASDFDSRAEQGEPIFPLPTKPRKGETKMIIERSDLNQARETMRPYFNHCDAEIVSEDMQGCPRCNKPLRYEGRCGEEGYRAFAYCPRCDYTEEF